MISSPIVTLIMLDLTIMGEDVVEYLDFVVSAHVEQRRTFIVKIFCRISYACNIFPRLLNWTCHTVIDEIDHLSSPRVSILNPTPTPSVAEMISSDNVVDTSNPKYSAPSFAPTNARMIATAGRKYGKSSMAFASSVNKLRRLRIAHMLDV